MYKFKFIVCLIFSFSISNVALADSSHYLDFKYILNSSDAGKKAQSFLKKTLDNGLKNLSQKEKKILDEEKKIISQKKVISQEEYKKKVSDLRAKVSSLQKDRNALLNTVAKKRAKAKEVLLKNLNPIVKDYMNEKNIRVVLDKKSILLADEKLDITKDIMDLLNKKLNSINLD